MSAAGGKSDGAPDLLDERRSLTSMVHDFEPVVTTPRRKPTEAPGLTVAEALAVARRFYPKVEQREPGECWPWIASLTPAGYGHFRLTSKTTTGAHRVAYVLHHGDLPEFLTIDHLCRNRRCCNPAHLEAVTLSENVRRRGPSRTGPMPNRQDCCHKGHPLDQVVHRSNGTSHRRCGTCAREATRRYEAKRERVRGNKPCPVCEKPVNDRGVARHIRRMHA